MSLKTRRVSLSMPTFWVDYLDELAEELEGSRSALVEAITGYIAANEDDFKAWIGSGLQDGDDDEDDDDEDQDEDQDEDEEPKGLFKRILG